MPDYWLFKDITYHVAFGLLLRVVYYFISENKNAYLLSQYKYEK